ncbi:MAG TPA: T9SS type A sorting domain-containing protein [Puia sp.]|nr:T9SS type A sorting domain-containing protein [Puia sp.]
MKQIIAFLSLVFSTYQLSAQLTITSGAQFTITGNAQLTLVNTDLINNGSFATGSGAVLFTGNAVSRIIGSQNITFYDLNIGKAAASVQLHVPVSVSHKVGFISGLLDLNANVLDLDSTGALNGEQEASHIIGTNGGTVNATANLNDPAAANPGNLGILITSSQNLGNTIIKRGHQSQTNNNGGGNSVLRYYDISPTNNTDLDASLRFNYLNVELNGLDANGLVLWETQNTQKWTTLGFDTRNTTIHYIEKNAITSLGRFTLSSFPNALPVSFISFTANCNGNTVLLAWKTAQEQNSQYYLVEKSADGIAWHSIGKIAAAGNSTAETDYVFTDNNAGGSDYYRIAEYDADGSAMYTNILHANCWIQETLKLWPNPASDLLYINLPALSNSTATIKLLDGKGALAIQQTASLTNGNNLISVNIKSLAAGLYYVSIITGSGQLQTQKLLKK